MQFPQLGQGEGHVTVCLYGQWQKGVEFEVQTISDFCKKFPINTPIIVDTPRQDY